METLLYQPNLHREADAIPVAWFYPAPYSVAMSSLGYLSLFRQLDQRPDVAPQRFNTDNSNTLRVNDYELMGLSFAFELDIIEIVKQFRQLGIPLMQADREGTDCPLIFAGGPVPTTNPEPYADFFDFFIVGDGEDSLDNILSTYKRIRGKGLTREQQLRELAKSVPGLYAPSLYDVSYESPSGPIAAITPKYDDAPAQIQRQSFDFKDSVNTSPILTEESVFPNKYLIEVMRGCAHRCRFCLASYATLPAKGPEGNALLQAVDTGLTHTRKIGLLGALVADHPDFDALCERLLAEDDVHVSMASLRADTLTPLVAKTVKHTRQNSVTIAVESGSERLRKGINKHLKTESILSAAEHLAVASVPAMKLYFMVGLPGEQDEDIDDSIALLQQIKKAHPKLKLTAGCSTFVPKALTPFQWQGRLDSNTLAKRQERFRKGIVKIADFRPTSAKWDTFQALLSRGDRRLTPFILEFIEQGGNLGAVNRTIKTLKERYNGALPFPEPDWYANRERQREEVLPWDLLFLGVSKDNLYNEAQVSLQHI